MGANESRIQMGGRQSNETNTSDDCKCFNPFAMFDVCGKKYSKRRNRRNNPFGTPLPDTPQALRRQRIEAANGFDHNYDFLDLESSKRDAQVFLDLHRSHSGSVTTSKITTAKSTTYRLNDELEQNTMKDHIANIHDGKKSEKELYQKYNIGDVLGVGSTSTCYRCINRSTGEKFACKVIEKKIIEKHSKGMSEKIYDEILTLRSLHHPNIVSIYDFYITDDKIYIVMELMEGGELFDHVVKKGTLTEDEASAIVRKVISAVVYMHQKNIIHRDLKPENLMLSREPRSPLDLEVKIIDFGLSKRLEGPVTHSFLGTRGYLAPEMLQRREYSCAVDAWALGVIVFVLLCGCLPFDDESVSIPSDTDVTHKFHLRFPRWAKNISASAKDLLSRLLEINPTRRLTPENALNHPWVTGVDIPKNNYLSSPGRIGLPKQLRNRNVNSPYRHRKSNQQHFIHATARDYANHAHANRAMGFTKDNTAAAVDARFTRNPRLQKKLSI